MHHVAYEVDDVRAALADLAEQGAELIDAEPRRGLFGLEVAFVHPDPSTASSRRWCRVADGDRVRVEIGFEGGQMIGGFVAAAAAEELERALARGRPARRRARHRGRPYTSSCRRSPTSGASAARGRVGFGTG